MKFVCSKSVLNGIINVVQKAIGAKTSFPILECIKIDAQTDGHVTFTSNSIELCIEYTSDISVYESGTVAIPSKIFGEIVRRLPDGEVHVNVDPSSFVTDIECEQSKFNIQGMSANEFPEVPKVDSLYTTEMSQKMLKNIIRKIFPFIAQTETRKPVLTGALFDFKTSRLNVVATDSYRLAVIKLENENDNTEKKFIVPGMTLSRLSQILTDDEESTLKVIVSDKHILFDFGDYQVYSRLLDGEFLRYEVILGAANSIKIKVDKTAIINSLERANLIINDELSSKTDNKTPVRLNINSGRIDISCKTSRGNVNDSVSIEHEGGDLIIGMNCRFILDALNSCDDETVVMEFSSPTGGCFIRPEDVGDKYTYMIQPVRLYN